MTESSDPLPSSPTTEEPPSTQPTSARNLSRWVVVIPALALLVGLVLGGLVVGVAQDGGDTVDQVPRDSQSPRPDPSPEPGTAVIAPDSCLQSAETVRQATDLIRGGIESIQEFRAEEIIDLLNELEDLDALARQQAATCSGTTITDAPLPSSPGSPEPTTSVSPEPAPEPSASR